MSETQTGRDDCYICGEGNPDILETHHIVPRRHGGGDESENLVDLCPSCHRAIEKLYDKRFYNALDVETESRTHGQECAKEDCTNRNTDLLKNQIRGIELPVCQSHQECCHDGSMLTAGCTRDDVTPVPHATDETLLLVCEKHRLCSRGECSNKNVEFVDGVPSPQPYCSRHAGERLAQQYKRGDLA